MKAMKDADGRFVRALEDKKYKTLFFDHQSSYACDDIGCKLIQIPFQVYHASSNVVYRLLLFMRISVKMQIH